MSQVIIRKEDLDYLLLNLDEIKKNRAVRSGLAAGAKVLRSAGLQRLRSRTKRQTGNLQGSLATRVKRSSLGALVGFGEKGQHAHLVDKGTLLRRKRNGQSTGRMPAYKFWSDTRDADYGTAIKAVETGINRAVERINNRT